MLLKRKHDELDDSEDESSYGKQILPVANLPDNFNQEPTDGMQYLFTVRRAARQLPDVCYVANPFETEERMVSGTSEPNVSAELPSEEWRELFEYRFLNFRKNFNQPTIHVGPPKDGSRRLMPEKKDRDMWWAFLQGKPESEWISVPKWKGKHKKYQYQASSRKMRAWPDEPPSRPEFNESSQHNDEGEVEQVLRVDPADSLPSPAGTPVPLPLEFLEEMMQPSASGSGLCYTSADKEHRPREPTTTLLKLIDGKTALHLLMYFTHWIQLYLKNPEVGDHVLTESHARWIFALLSRVEEHVSADDMNLLRNLARACFGLLKDVRGRSMTSLSSQRMGELSCWLVVTIVADVWKQRDLWIDAESILANTEGCT